MAREKNKNKTFIVLAGLSSNSKNIFKDPCFSGEECGI